MNSNGQQLAVFGQTDNAGIFQIKKSEIALSVHKELMDHCGFRLAGRAT